MSPWRVWRWERSVARVVVTGRIRSKEEGTWGAPWRSFSFRERRGAAGSVGWESDRRVSKGRCGSGSVAEGAFSFLKPVFFFLGGI
jgi:hypothetical protein